MPDFLHCVHPVNPSDFAVCKVKCVHKYGETDVYSSDHMMGKKQKMLDSIINVKTSGLVFSVVGRQELKHIKPSPSSFTIKLVS